MTAWLSSHIIDFLVLSALGWYVFDGWRRGLLAIGFETIGFVVAMLAAAFGYHFAGPLLAKSFAISPAFADVIAFFFIWWLIDLAWPLGARVLYRRLPERWRAAKIDRWFGVAPGLANGALVLSVILTVALAFPLPGAMKKTIADSGIVQPLLAVARGFDRLVKPLLGPLSGSGLDVLTIHPGSEETVDLHFTLHDGVVDEQDEATLLTLVNAERTRQGLAALTLDPRLRDVARAHSRDMFEHGYFAHLDPAGLNPSDRIDRAGISYGLMGENLAFASDVTTAHRGLMDSPSHRANILEPGFRKIGVGIIDGGVYGIMITQMFTN